ncbi:MAG: hypothetical protein AAF844_10825 [Pseudomonadota bacterium]
MAVSVNAIQSEGPCDKRYIVERGDTLSIIAGRVLGDIRAFDRLHALNRATIGPNPAELEVGTVLRLPCPEERAEEAPVVAAAPTLDLPAEAEAAEDEARRASPSLGVTLIRAPALAAALRRDRRLQVVDLRETRPERTFVPRALALPRSTWPDTGPFLPFLSRAGLRIDRPVVLIGEDAGADALARSAYVAWALRRVGMADIRLLIGGQAQWESRRRPLWAGPATPRPRRVLPGLLDVEVAGETTEDPVVLSIGAPRVGATEAPRFPEIAPLLAEGRVEEAALEALVWAKAQEVDWERRLVLVTAETRDEAALAWMMLSVFAGIPKVDLLPASAAGIAGGAAEREGG